MSRPSRSSTPGSPGLVGIVAGALLVLSLGAGTAFAKEGVEVSLAVPLPGDAAPGSTVTAVFILKALSDAGEKPLRGSPVFIRLYGPTGASTQGEGVEDRTPGTYRAQVEIPAGGAARAEFGIHGAATDASAKTVPSDIVWPYDGILVSRAVPPPVDADTFQLPGSRPATDPAANPAGRPAAETAAGPTSTTPGTGAPLTIDARLVGIAIPAALAAVGLTLGARHRRRGPSSPA
ncbi:MAG TPA: hypothetical protein VM427_07175 [Patescibacteria group bacterium]|nr:hypothetical protein [Patescibacteria group bacterium]